MLENEYTKIYTKTIVHAFQIFENENPKMNKYQR
jgi:hypothetical protein